MIAKLKVLVFLMLLAACTEGGEFPIRPPKPPSLTLINALEDNYAIQAWTMERYTFEDLSIQPGEKESFLLLNGMPPSYKNLELSILFVSDQGFFTVSEVIDFSSGGTTTVMISGCGGCAENDMEWSW